MLEHPTLVPPRRVLGAIFAKKFVAENYGMDLLGNTDWSVPANSATK